MVNRPAIKWGKAIYACAEAMQIIAGVCLVFMMILTGFDIVGRAFGHPVPGTYEIVSALGGIVAGLAMPRTSWVRGHVTLDLLTERLSRRRRVVLSTITRLIGSSLFLLMGYSIVCIGLDLQRSQEVTPVLRLPTHLVAYGMGTAFLAVCAVLIVSMFRPDQGGNNE